jgi:hypothetical protein
MFLVEIGMKLMNKSNNFYRNIEMLVKRGVCKELIQQLLNFEICEIATVTAYKLTQASDKEINTLNLAVDGNRRLTTSHDKW